VFGLFGDTPKVTEPVGEIVEHKGVRCMLIEQVPAILGGFLGVEEDEDGEFSFGQPVRLVRHEPTKVKMEDEAERDYRRSILREAEASQPNDVLDPNWRPSNWQKEPDKRNYLTAWVAHRVSDECHEDCAARKAATVFWDMERDEDGTWPPFLDALCEGHREMVVTWMATEGHLERRRPGDPMRVAKEDDDG